MYVYQKKLEQLSKTQKQLPEEILSSIEALEQMELKAEELDANDDDDDDIRQIQIDIKSLDNDIANAIEEFFDDELEAQSCDEERREELLEELFNKGIKTITLEKLKGLGYTYSGDVTLAPAGCYRLERPDQFRRDYKIVKLKA